MRLWEEIRQLTWEYTEKVRTKVGELCAHIDREHGGELSALAKALNANLYLIVGGNGNPTMTRPVLIAVFEGDVKDRFEKLLSGTSWADGYRITVRAMTKAPKEPLFHYKP